MMQKRLGYTDEEFKLFSVKGHDIPHPGVTKIPHPISQD
jgi:hypothetical protein